MDDGMTIGQVSKGFGISTRMLRYYEKAGLISSTRREGYAYRVYDEEALLRLRQILILRRLRIPVKQIRRMLEDAGAAEAVRILEENLSEVDSEIGALQTIRGILARFIERLGRLSDIRLSRLLTEDETLGETLQALSLISINFREDQTMENLEKASEQLQRLTDVRILYIPPMTVAASHFIGDDPEDVTGARMEAFIREADLLRKKPDLRQFGFNHPNPKDATGFHGYEFWVSIPEDLDVPAPMERKQFPGGLYAAHMIPIGNFQDWDLLIRWVAESADYDFAGDFADQEHMCGLLEEHLNIHTHMAQGGINPERLQLDLLAPVRLK